MFQFDEMMGLFLLVFAFLIIVGIISRGNIAGLFDIFQGVPKNYDIAKYSVDALACAIRNVAAGEKVCVMPGMEEEGSELTGFFARLLGKASTRISEEEYASVPEGMRSALSCGNPQGKIRCEYCVLNYAGGNITEKYLIYADNEIEAEKMCEEYIRENGGLGPYVVPKDSPGLSWWPSVDKCERVEVESCKVENFYIPLDFQSTPLATAREYIEGYGDPVLVYWQQFPPGEDTWNSWSSLFQSIGTGFFASTCLLRAAGGLFVVPMRVGTKLVRASTVSQQTTRFLNWLKRVGGKVTSKIGSITLRSGATLDDIFVAAGRRMSRNSLFRALFNAYKTTSKYTQLANNPKVKAVAKATGLITADAVLAARFKTELGKFLLTYPNSLVLVNPINNFSMEPIPLDIEPYRRQQYIVNPTRQNLVDLKRPVLLHKESSVGSGHLIPLTLAGPCHADLEVTPEDVTCGFYFYDSEGYVTCETPILRTLWSEKVFGRKNRPMCGSLPTGMPQKHTEYFSNREAEIIENIGKVRIFDDPDENGRWQKIIDPIYNVTFYYNTTTNEFYKVVTSYGEEITPDFIGCTDMFSLDDLTLSDSNERVYTCHLSMAGVDAYASKTVGSAGSYFNPFSIKYIHTLLEVFGNLENKTFENILYTKIGENPGGNKLREFNVILSDRNKDGMVDSVVHYWGTSGTDALLYSIFSDDDFDGDVDSLAGSNCVVPAIIVRADASKYDDDPNYCYQKDRAWIGTAIMVGSFIFDSLAKTVGGPIGYAAGTAIDCGLAVLNLVIVDEWPRGGIG